MQIQAIFSQIFAILLSVLEVYCSETLKRSACMMIFFWQVIECAFNRALLLWTIWEKMCPLDKMANISQTIFSDAV